MSPKGGLKNSLATRQRPIGASPRTPTAIRLLGRWPGVRRRKQRIYTTVAADTVLLRSHWLSLDARPGWNCQSFLLLSASNASNSPVNWPENTTPPALKERRRSREHRSAIPTWSRQLRDQWR